jgi:hypothetical protein
MIAPTPQWFKARFLKTLALSSLDGIEKYLGSGMIRGIGQVYAKKTVKAFSEKVFDVIEAEPGRLREVRGIDAILAQGTPKRAHSPASVSVSPRHRINSDGALGQLYPLRSNAAA